MRRISKAWQSFQVPPWRQLQSATSGLNNSKFTENDVFHKFWAWPCNIESNCDQANIISLCNHTMSGVPHQNSWAATTSTNACRSNEQVNETNALSFHRPFAMMLKTLHCAMPQIPSGPGLFGRTFLLKPLQLDATEYVTIKVLHC